MTARDDKHDEDGGPYIPPVIYDAKRGGFYDTKDHHRLTDAELAEYRKKNPGNYDPNESADERAARLAKVARFVAACQGSVDLAKLAEAIEWGRIVLTGGRPRFTMIDDAREPRDMYRDEALTIAAALRAFTPSHALPSDGPGLLATKADMDRIYKPEDFGIDSAPSTIEPKHFPDWLADCRENKARELLKEAVPYLGLLNEPVMTVTKLDAEKVSGRIVSFLLETPETTPSATGTLEVGKPCPTCAEPFCAGLTLAEGHKLHIDRQRLVTAVMDELDCMRRGISVSRSAEVPDPLPMLRLWTASRDQLDASERAREEGMRRADGGRQTNG